MGPDGMDQTAWRTRMNAHCCEHQPAFDGLSPAYRRALWVVIAINAAMFAVEMIAGAMAGSQALQADALDFLGDTATYGISLAVLGLPLRARATAALAKGASLAVMGAWVLGATAYQVFVLGMPRADIMGLIGLLALVANLASVLVLMSYRNGDSNVRSVWLCSRNDALANVAVLLAAGGVFATASRWPDLLVAVAIAALALHSARDVLQQSRTEIRTGRAGYDPASVAGHGD